MMLKNKLDQDQMAMIIADWLDGELTTCRDIPYCDKSCPLTKEFIQGMTICQALEEMSEKLNEVEK